MNSGNLYVYPYNAALSDTERSILLPLNKSIEARMRAIGCCFSFSYPSIDECLPVDIKAIDCAIHAFENSDDVVNVGESGTAMRLMLAIIALKTTKSIRLEGSGRQHQRPIGPLVEALRSMGCKIVYVSREGYPPLMIHPPYIDTVCTSVVIDQTLSSQFVSALLIALSTFPIGFTIEVVGKTVSLPYIDMTISCLAKVGILWETNNHRTYVLRSKSIRANKPLYQERDWSSAAFAYLLVTVYPQLSGLKLKNLFMDSIQGDCKATIDAFRRIGLETIVVQDGLIIENKEIDPQGFLSIDMQQSPDLVPAFVVALLSKQYPFDIYGIEHLAIKESNRIEALCREAMTLGYPLSYNEGHLTYTGERQTIKENHTLTLSSHHDHRIAMAFAPLLSRCRGGIIMDAMVIEKSYPLYWDNLTILGIKSKEI